MTAIMRSQGPKSVWRLMRHYGVKPNPKAVVIAAAVRTPNTLLSDATEEHQLAGLVIDELVKRTSVPRDEFKKLILCTSSDIVSNDTLSSVAKNLGLKSCQTHAIQGQAFSVSGLQMSLESLQHNEADWIILGDTRAHLQQPEEDVLPSELMTATVPTKRANAKQPASTECPGAAALALTTAQTAERLQLQPLALVREFFIEQDNTQAIYRLNGSQPIQLTDVHTWQLVMREKQQEQLGMLAELKINDVHTHDVQQITASHLLTHTVHALPVGSLGCVIMDSGDGRCVLLVLEKLVPESVQDKSLPQLTLYTKEPCPLCDELVTQLEQNFGGEFELKKVFIDRKENLRYLRLFRYDIPVLFLNGQFLCMHSLNEQLLRDRLAALKNSAALPKDT